MEMGVAHRMKECGPKSHNPNKPGYDRSKRGGPSGSDETLITSRFLHTGRIIHAIIR